MHLKVVTLGMICYSGYVYDNVLGCYVCMSGGYPVESLEHPSLMYLYSYVRSVLLAVMEVSTNSDTLNKSISLEAVSLNELEVMIYHYGIVMPQVLAWLRMFVHVCTWPSVTLSSTACSWTLIKFKTLLSLCPMLQTARQVSVSTIHIIIVLLLIVQSEAVPGDIGYPFVPFGGNDNKESSV